MTGVPQGNGQTTAIYGDHFVDGGATDQALPVMRHPGNDFDIIVSILELFATLNGTSAEISVNVIKVIHFELQSLFTQTWRRPPTMAATWSVNTSAKVSEKI